MRKDFIENSQSYAFDNSQYVEYNQIFSKEREKNIKSLMEDVELLKVKNIKLKEQANKDKHEVCFYTCVNKLCSILKKTCLHIDIEMLFNLVLVQFHF